MHRCLWYTLVFYIKIMSLLVTIVELLLFYLLFFFCIFFENKNLIPQKYVWTQHIMVLILLKRAILKKSSVVLRRKSAVPLSIRISARNHNENSNKKNEFHLSSFLEAFSIFNYSSWVRSGGF